MIQDAPAGLVTLLNTMRQVVVADLYTITTSGGVVFRFTSFDRPISYGGNTWLIGPVLSRDRVSVSAGFEVPTMTMTIAADESVIVNGQPFIRFIGNGGLDSARVLVERAYMADPASPPSGKLYRFSGQVVDQRGVVGAQRITVKSDIYYLSTMVPRNVCQPACDNTLYDGSCGVSRAAFTSSGAATSATDSRRMYFSHNLSNPSGFFTFGVVKFTSGANAGVSRTVKIHNGASGGDSMFPSSTLVAIAAWPADVAVGDTFTVYAGCDKTKASCVQKFANGSRFRGMPFIPVANTVT